MNASREAIRSSHEASRSAFALLVLAIAASLACAPPVSSGTRGPSHGREPTVVLISLDGTRPADVTEAQLPALVALGRAGAVAEGLIPVDPANTFPSHVSMATGVRPDRHRLVNNSFIDPVRGRFKRSAPHEWIESEPIWSIVEREGMRSAAYHWVGSEGPWAAGPGPSDTRKFSSRTLEKTKVDRILEWLLDPDPATRPRLILSWFHGADHAAHVSGPGTPAVARALEPQNVQIARLVETMEANGLFETTTLLFVSDHGMIGAERRIDLSARLAKAGLRPSVLGIGGFASIVFSHKQRTPRRLARALEVARAAGLEAWLRSEAPRDWHVDDPRFGDLVVRAPIGTAIVTRTAQLEGFHGYDGRVREMAGLFVARGRGVRPATRLGRVSSLALAPTVLALLGIAIPAQMEVAPIAELLSGVTPRFVRRSEAPVGAAAAMSDVRMAISGAKR